MNIHEKAFCTLLKKKHELVERRHQILNKIKNGNKNLINDYLDVDHELRTIEEAISMMTKVLTA